MIISLNATRTQKKLPRGTSDINILSYPPGESWTQTLPIEPSITMAAQKPQGLLGGNLDLRALGSHPKDLSSRITLPTNPGVCQFLFYYAALNSFSNNIKNNLTAGSMEARRVRFEFRKL